MMNDDPIREPESLFQKIKGLFKKKTHSVEFEYEYNDMRHTFDGCTRLKEIPAIEIDTKTLKNFGISTEDACERIMRFSKILTPNEMRELIERRKQW